MILLCDLWGLPSPTQSGGWLGLRGLPLEWTDGANLPGLSSRVTRVPEIICHFLDLLWKKERPSFFSQQDGSTFNV